MQFPSAPQYVVALASSEALVTQTLAQGALDSNVLGPLSWPGGCAVVFRWRSRYAKDCWAVRCFTEHIPNLASVYANLSAHLNAVSLPYFLPAYYEPDAVRVGKSLFPIVRTPWVDAPLLKKYVDQCISSNSIATLVTLAERWQHMLRNMRTCDIAHGDLHHGNIFVGSSGDLILIDYDGVVVPANVGEPLHLAGYGGYQHPRAGQLRQKSLQLDNFPGIAIYVALRALANKPALWAQRHLADDATLLFSTEDLSNPTESEVFRLLKRAGGETARLSQILASLCQAPDPASIPPLDLVVSRGYVGISSAPRSVPLPPWMQPPPTETPKAPAQVSRAARRPQAMWQILTAVVVALTVVASAIAYFGMNRPSLALGGLLISLIVAATMLVLTYRQKLRSGGRS